MEEIKPGNFAALLRSRVWFGRRESHQEPIQISTRDIESIGGTYPCQFGKICAEKMLSLNEFRAINSCGSRRKKMLDGHCVSSEKVKFLGDVVIFEKRGL
jgi:hypothetical protein